jgi:hypothetical protein
MRRFYQRLVCMKSLFLILFLMSVSLGFSATAISLPVAAPISDDVLLRAIAEVETGNNSARLGRYGERTQLQILPNTWREFSSLPHSASATNRAETERVARAYLARIRARLKARDLPETPFFIAAAWNAGPGWKKLSRGTISYAERVANIVEAAPSTEPAPATVAETVPLIEVGNTAPSPVILLAQPKPTGTLALVALP